MIITVNRENDMLAFTRTWEKETVLAAANVGETDRVLTVKARSVKIPAMTSVLMKL